MTAPFRILILGDFGAREHRGLGDAGTIAARKPRRVDRDDLDQAIAALAPEIHLTLEPGAEPVVVRVSELEDFHPDRLVERVADFQRLRELRSQIGEPGSTPSAPRTHASPDAPSSTAVSMSQGSVLDMILAGEPGAPTSPAVARPRDELSEYVSDAVRKHAAPARTADQETLMKQIDDVIAATMRVVLHQPDFQAAEALWRGVSFLVRHLDTDETLQVFVADISKAELSSALFEDSNGARALRKLLRGEQSPGKWSLVVGLYSFRPNETPFIASVATLARETGVPWVSSAHAHFAGTTTFADGADLDDWDQMPLVEWDEFRHGDEAKWISLAIPRILLRVPYGKSSDECSVIRFEETDQGELAHEQYLWGNGALLCAALLGEAAASDSPAPTQGVVGGLPLHVAKVDGLSEVKPSTEAVIAQRALAHLLDRGLTALACERDGDSVRIPRLQSVSLPAARLASPTGTDA